MARVLVTGATGLLGGPATRQLVELGHTVVGLDLAPNAENLGDVADDVNVIRGNVADLPTLIDVMKTSRIERVLHLAAALGGVASPLETIVANTLATGYVFHAACALDIERVCWASSAGVYGWRHQYPSDELLDEDALLGPWSVYRASKFTCEQLAMAYHESRGLDVIGIRPVTSYGIGRLGVSGTGKFNETIFRVAQGDPAVFPPTLGALDARWQPMYNKDVGAAFVAGTLVERTEHQIFNAPVNEIVTIRETMDLLRELVPTADLVFGTESQADMTADGPLLKGARAQQELGFVPSYDLRAGFTEMIEHYRTYKR